MMTICFLVQLCKCKCSLSDLTLIARLGVISGLLTILCSATNDVALIWVAADPEDTNNADDSDSTPPLIQPTKRGTYLIRLDWDPTLIEMGNKTTFDISFMDNTGKPVTIPTFTFIVTDLEGNEMLNEKYDSTNSTKQTVIFDKAGSFVADVCIHFPGGAPYELMDCSIFAFEVVPEFGSTVAITLISGSVFGILIIGRRYWLKFTFKRRD